MEKSATKGMVVLVIMLNVLVMVLHALPTAPRTVPDLREGQGNEGDKTQTDTLHINRPRIVPMEFSRYAEIFDIIARLEELKEEINKENDHMKGNQNEARLINNGPYIDITFEGLVEHIVNDQSSTGITRPKTDLDTSNDNTNTLEGIYETTEEGISAEESINIERSSTNKEDDVDEMGTGHEGDTIENVDNTRHNTADLNEFDVEFNTRMKRSTAMSNADLSSIVGNICMTDECLKELQQYIAWREKNGYPGYTGVWKVGK